MLLEKITVCGDTHGQFYDLANIFKINGLPSEENPYLFNGDFVDRGSFSAETVITLLAFKIVFPNHFFLSRGNHETKAMNKVYGFEGEIKGINSSIHYFISFYFPLFYFISFYFILYFALFLFIIIFFFFLADY